MTGILRVLILARIVTAVVLEVLQASATICLVEEPFNWATYYSLAISATDLEFVGFSTDFVIVVAFVDFEDSSAVAARAFVIIGESFAKARFEEQQPTAIVVAVIEWHITVTTNQIGQLIPYFE